MTSWFHSLRARWGKRKPPVIMTTIDGQEHQVTESARHQGAINMKLSLAKRIEVERWFVDKFGEEEGMRRCRHQFPEAYED